MFLKEKEGKIYKHAYKAIKEGDTQILKLCLERLLPDKIAQRLKVKQTSDVLDLLKAGKITIEEAERLMKLLKDQSEIEELKKIEERIAQLESKGGKKR